MHINDEDLGELVHIGGRAQPAACAARQPAGILGSVFWHHGQCSSRDYVLGIA